jgi:hypothetical protein
MVRPRSEAAHLDLGFGGTSSSNLIVVSSQCEGQREKKGERLGRGREVVVPRPNREKAKQCLQWQPSESTLNACVRVYIWRVRKTRWYRTPRSVCHSSRLVRPARIKAMQDVYSN